ncbi:hypothetical protein CBOM_02464 [Ceraceosorus bombacis]|uniref:Uncharacterized protein n=1 Tax=Ceraceosorus bombacis TaxID=401625 RepID=A0A0P1BFG2_9BASI|nr:hypothetical protein CBOM_02464 [Ceraceosorus bombacis]
MSEEVLTDAKLSPFDQSQSTLAIGWTCMISSVSRGFNPALDIIAEPYLDIAIALVCVGSRDAGMPQPSCGGRLSVDAAAEEVRRRPITPTPIKRSIEQLGGGRTQNV